MNIVRFTICILIGVAIGTEVANAQKPPAREEVITPIRNESFNKNGSCKERRQGGNPRTVDGMLVFDGSQDGNRQVDPQIAVGGDHVLHGTNSGLIIYDKAGNFVSGVNQNCFNGGIDPKLYFDIHNKMFVFDLWNPWDREKLKPVNVSVSETSDPTGAWNTYPIPAPNGVDGGAIAGSRKWIGYTFPGGKEQMFVFKADEAKAGKPVTVYHFEGNPGEPVKGQDATDDLYFLKFTNREIVISRVTENADGEPQLEQVANQKHGLSYYDYPPQSPQKGTDQKTSSGDRNPKVLVLQNECIWFSQAVNCEGRSAVQWHQVRLDGSLAQSGLLRHPTNGYIQTTLAVNAKEDLLIGFQETGPDMYISPRFAVRRGTDPPGETRAIVSLGEGAGATDGVAWGDYSGSTIDGDNGRDLWTIQSITSPQGKGHTVIARFPIED
ncbi:MAG: hypothetical protein ACK5YR_00180 [Pirellula sp.]|jgi:hypothetical protein